jgi:regulatory protein
MTKMTSLLNTALKFISERRCSEQELRSYLSEQFIGTTDIEDSREKIIAYLKEQGVLNDLRLAYHFASNYSHKGNDYIRQLLLERQMSNKDIAIALDFLPDEETRAWSEAKKKLARLQGQTERELKVNLTRFLVGRRFAPTTIKAVLERLVNKNHYLQRVLSYSEFRKTG